MLRKVSRFIHLYWISSKCWGNFCSFAYFIPGFICVVSTAIAQTNLWKNWCNSLKSVKLFSRVAYNLCLLLQCTVGLAIFQYTSVFKRYYLSQIRSCNNDIIGYTINDGITDIFTSQEYSSEYFMGSFALRNVVKWL